MKKKMIFILGPTASGKSEIAVELAERIGGEIISCDSMQVYKGMDVVTRAPGTDLENRVPHHLVRVISPEEEFSVARYVKLSLKAVEEVTFRRNVPVFAGGTGLYVKALLDGLFPSPPKDEDLRSRLARISEEKGARYLHEKLREKDPGTAESIDANNTRKVIRALEVIELTGKTFSDKKNETEGFLKDHDPGLFGLSIPRQTLYDRINGRVDKMFDEERIVEKVASFAFEKMSMTAAKAIGIEEVKRYLSGKITIEEAREELKKNTRRYAKRQMTWFKGDKRIEWIDADRQKIKIVKDILQRIRA